MSKIVARFGPYQAVAVKGRLVVYRCGRYVCQWPRSSDQFKAPEFAMRKLVSAEVDAKYWRAARVAYGRERKAAARAAAAASAGGCQLSLF